MASSIQGHNLPGSNHCTDTKTKLPLDLGQKLRGSNHCTSLMKNFASKVYDRN